MDELNYDREDFETLALNWSDEIDIGFIKTLEIQQEVYDGSYSLLDFNNVFNYFRY